MDDGIIMITEDELDDVMGNLFNPPGLPKELMSGCNIKTACYGLFLVALDHNLTKKQTKEIEQSIKKLDNITDCTAFNFLSLFFPPYDISLEGILTLSKAVYELDNLAQGLIAERISPETGDTIMVTLKNVLEPKSTMMEVS
jgi:hypothetical protein